MFTTGDGVFLKAWYASPKNGAAIILLHRVGILREAVRSYAALLVRHGYGVLAPGMLPSPISVKQSLNISHRSPFRRKNDLHRSHQTADLGASHTKHPAKITRPHIAVMALGSCRFTAIGARYGG
jgi:dienelactone hydrolase